MKAVYFASSILFISSSIAPAQAATYSQGQMIGMAERCMHIQHNLTPGYEAVWEKVRTQYEDVPMTDADKMNGLDGYGKITLVFPQRKTGDDWVMGIYEINFLNEKGLLTFQTPPSLFGMVDRQHWSCQYKAGKLLDPKPN